MSKSRPRSGNSGRRAPLRRAPRCERLEERTLPSAGLLAVDPGSYDPTEILVRFQPGSPADMVAAQVVPGTAIERSIELVPGLHQVRLDGGMSVQAALAAYRANPFVLYAEPDYRVQLQRTPNDPQYPSQWDLHNTGQTGGTSDADIDAPEAWDVTTGSGSFIVAVIDTGVDYRHPDLAANMWTNVAERDGRSNIDDDGNGYIDDIHGYDFYNRDGDPLDDNNHGTHVAGTIGAVGDNSVGVSGINWRARIMALKFLNAQGSGTSSDAILALNYAVANGAKISNNSYGGDPYSQALFDAIRNARDAGHIYVAAAGNGDFFGIGLDNDQTPFYPASYNLANIVAVAATDHNDALAVFSNYGATSVDLGAPGVSILSTTRNNTYNRFDGTSMAAPHVAGALALVWDLHPTWTYQQVIDFVLGTVDPLPALQGKTVTGGRLNIGRAVQPPPVIDLNWTSSGLVAPATAHWQTPFTVSRTYAISGEAAQSNFTIGYYSSADTVFGNADDVLLATETLTSAADKTIGSHGGTSPALQITTGGTMYLFARVDNGRAIFETDESNNVVQAPQPILVTGPVIVDNAQPGYSETGSGWLSWSAGYGGTLRYHAPGAGANTAAWQAGGLPSGYYMVQSTWNGDNSHPDNAPYSIYDGATLLQTVLVNQKPAPVGTVIGGVAFQNLATVRITGSTVRVVVSDNANGYVVADAIRLVPIPPPLIDLHWAGGGISGPPGADTQSSFTLSRTYTISGEAAATAFTIAYYRSADATFGNADDVLLGSEALSSAADRAVGSHSGNSPAFTITTGGTYYLFAKVDGNGAILESDETNNVAQAPTPLLVSVPIIVDNGQAGYSETGTGWQSWSAGYGGNLRFHAAGTGANTAVWQLGGLAPGYYRVQATWNGDPGHAGNAPYGIYDGAALLQTVLVNQRPWPSGDVVGGIAFQNLATVQLTGSALSVVLSDNANGYIVADAVRIVPMPAPIIDLNWVGGGITGPSSGDVQTSFTLNRTYTISGAPASANFAIAYYASSDATFGNADDVLLGSETITSAADKTVGNHAGVSPALLIATGGTYNLFAKIDSGHAILETDEGNNIAQAPQPIVVLGPVIVDNGQTGYSETGSGWMSWSAGYGGNLRFHAAGTGANSAVWQRGVPTGYYRVQATWNADFNHASNAAYGIYDGATLLQTVVVDQRPAPVGDVVSGIAFQTLATVQVTGGTLRVVLSDNGNGYIVADAVRIVPLPPPTIDLHWSGGGLSGPAAGDVNTSFTLSRTYLIGGAAATADFTIAYFASGDATFGNADDVLLGSETITSAADKTIGSHSGTSPSLRITTGGTHYLFARIDNGGAILETNETNNVVQAPQAIVVTGPLIVDNAQPGYSEAGTGWHSWAAGYAGNLRFHAPGSGANTATWQASGLPAGNYVVQSTWNGDFGHAANAPYRIYDGAVLLTTVLVDQRPWPSGDLVGGVRFQNLVTVPITSGTVRVVLSDNAGGYIVADAIRLVPSSGGQGLPRGPGAPGPLRVPDFAPTSETPRPFGLDRRGALPEGFLAAPPSESGAPAASGSRNLRGASDGGTATPPEDRPDQLLQSLDEDVMPGAFN